MPGAPASRLPLEFPFERRVAPQADDPINALLNLGFTVLHRMAAGLLRSAGFAVSLGLLHTPVLYVIGGETDVAWGNSQDDFSRIDRVPVFLANLKGVGHGGTYWEPNGGKAAAAVVAWLDWQLRGDARARSRFVGADCGLCRDASWVVQKKRID